MKTSICIRVLLLAALAGALASPLSAAPATAQGGAVYRVSSVWIHGARNIKVGSADSTVRFHLGTPTKQPTDNVWIYRSFTTNLDEANRRGCDTLVVTFKDVRVVSLTMVNEKAAAVIVAQSKANPNTTPSVLIAASN